MANNVSALTMVSAGNQAFSNTMLSNVALNISSALYPSVSVTVTSCNGNGKSYGCLYWLIHGQGDDMTVTQAAVSGGFVYTAASLSNGFSQPIMIWVCDNTTTVPTVINRVIPCDTAMRTYFASHSANNNYDLKVSWFTLTAGLSYSVDISVNVLPQQFSAHPTSIFDPGSANTMTVTSSGQANVNGTFTPSGNIGIIDQSTGHTLSIDSTGHALVAGVTTGNVSIVNGPNTLAIDSLGHASVTSYVRDITSGIYQSVLSGGYGLVAGNVNASVIGKVSSGGNQMDVDSSGRALTSSNIKDPSANNFAAVDSGGNLSTTFPTPLTISGNVGIKDPSSGNVAIVDSSGHLETTSVVSGNVHIQDATTSNLAVVSSSGVLSTTVPSNLVVSGAVSLKDGSSSNLATVSSSGVLSTSIPTSVSIKDATSSNLALVNSSGQLSTTGSGGGGGGNVNITGINGVSPVVTSQGFLCVRNT